MRKLVTIILLAALCAGAQAKSNPKVFGDSWTMQREGDSRSYSVKVPCTVAGALNEAGYFGENIFDKDNYKSLDRTIFDDAWVFTTSFDLKTKGLCHMLRFNGLGYSAEISLNGKVIASRDTTFGVFCVREFDITTLAKKHNTLKVKVWRAKSGDLNHGWVDWNPSPLDDTMGILRSVELISTPDVVVKDVFVKPVVDPEDLSQADIIVTATVSNLKNAPVSGTVRGIFDGGTFEQPVSLAAGETKVVTVKKNIVKPRIWWSHDMGKPELYNMTVAFVSGGKVSHEARTRFGIRSVTSEITAEGHRQFYLNGRPVLITSAGWTDDLFMQDTHESIRTQIEFVKDMGLNCVRFENIWGKDDYVYDLCDEMGLLTFVGWSCQWEWENYCGLPEVKKWGCINTPESEDLAVRYFHDQVMRLRNHASLIAWLTGSDRIPNPDVEKRYLKIYNELDYRPYVCSASSLTSLAGPSGNKMAGPYEYVCPDYWFVDTKFGGNYGFNTETGVGLNMPQAESVRRMVGEDHLWPVDSNWDYHCTASSSHMNTPRIAMESAAKQYGAPEGFEDFVRKVHAMDYEATRSMYEAFRCNVPVATGIVQWMLNSAWPSLYWQLYDWYMVPTAGYYGVKVGLKPIQLIYNYKEHAVYCVNENTNPEHPLKAVIKVFDAESRLVRKEEVEFTSTPRQPVKVLDGIEGPCFLSLVLRDHKDHRITQNFYCVGKELAEYNWKKTDWWGSPIISYPDLTFVSALPKVEVKLESKPIDGGFKVTLTNNSDVIAYQNILKAKDTEGNLIPAVKWTDNFFTLIPGESRSVKCSIPEGYTPVISLDGWNASAEMVHAPDSLDRNLSAYATYDFREDDKYSKEEDYPVITLVQPKGKKIKNVIFMIGDGMGFEQISCGWVVNGGKLNMFQMPYSGSSMTYATDRLVTDSCAGGNALSTGVKTKYGYIGMGPDANPLESSLQKAQQLGKKTGVVVSCRINDATPADFCCYSPTRKDEEGIAAQYVNSDVDIICGGGLHFWTSRSDGRNLVNEMVAKGYTFVDKLEDVRAARGNRLLGLFGEYDLPPVTERGPVLMECTMKALEMLDNKNGFFLMVEGSQIDDWAHRNKVGPMCEELFDFDKTLGAVLEWAQKDGQTLVVVTADHATGGLTLLKGSIEEHAVKVNYSTSGHNGIMVPVFAYGPGAARFAGVHDNSEVGQLVKDSVRK